jgi:hypothetical protein
MQRKIWGLAGLLSLCLLTTAAEAAKLAEVQAAFSGSENPETVTLYGDRLNGSSYYYQNLLLQVTDSEGRLKTAFTPSIRGGYFPFLKTFTLGKKHPQILLAVAQGEADKDVAYRLVDFSDAHKVKETFTGVDNFGVTTTARYLDGRRFRVSCDFGEKPVVLEAAAPVQDTLHVFDAAGSVQKSYLRPQVSRLISLTPVQDRLLSTQNILDADGTTLLGKLYITWNWNEEQAAWAPQSVHFDTVLDETKMEKARVNSSAAAGSWQLYNRIYVHQGVEISYPEVAVADHPEVQNKINAAVQAWLQEDKKNCQQAYRLEFTGPRLLSMLAFRQDGEGQITEKIFNFNMETGETVSLREMFNYQDKDFLPLLNLLGIPKNSVKSLPRDWYYNGGTFVFILPEADLTKVTAGGSDRGYFEPTPAEKAKPEQLKRKAAAARKQEAKLKQRAVPKAVFNRDGSFTKGQPLEVGVGAGYLVKFVTDKKLPLSH